MSIHDPIWRRQARMATRMFAMLCAVALAITGWGMSSSGLPEAGAARSGGAAQIVTPPEDASPGQPLTSGGSATPFSLELPTGAACTGDSANDDYRVQSYMVPEAVAPDTLRFGSSGPLPTGLGAAGFRQPLYTVTSTGYVDVQTANASTTGGPGPIVNIPAFSLGVFSPGDIPAGAYNVGIACTIGTSASPTQLDKYWNAQMTVVTAPGDEPAGVTWTVDAGATTTTTAPGTTSTSAPGSTTSTVAPGSTTSTTAGGTTTSTTAPTTTSTTGVTTSTTSPASTTSTTAAATTTSTTAGATTTSTTVDTTTSTSTPVSTTSTTEPTSTTSSTTSSSTSSTSSTTSTSTTAPDCSVASTTSTSTGSSDTCVPAGTTITSSVAAGGQITISSTGWQPGAVINGVLNSDPIALGTLTADASGLVAGAFTMPSSVPVGPHQLVLTGTDAAGRARTIRASVSVTADSGTSSTSSTSTTTTGGGRLPATGSSATALVGWALLMLAFGWVSILLGRSPRLQQPRG